MGFLSANLNHNSGSGGTYEGHADDNADERGHIVGCRDEAQCEAQRDDGEDEVEGAQHKLGDGERLADPEWLGLGDFQGLHVLLGMLAVGGLGRRAEACGSRLLRAAGLVCRWTLHGGLERESGLLENGLGNRVS